MPTSTYFTGPIEKRMNDDLHLAGVAERTRKGYLRAVRQLAGHAKCSPDKIDEEQLRQWLLHLKVDKQLAQCRENNESGLQNRASKLPWLVIWPDHRCKWLHFAKDIAQNLMGSARLTEANP